jgi:prophage regulatory protein
MLFPEPRKDPAVLRSPDRILRLPEVLRRTGLSQATIYRKQDGATFPASIKLSARCIGWRESVIEAWLRNRTSYHVDDTR